MKLSARQSPSGCATVRVGRGVRLKPDTASKVQPKAATSMRFEALGKVGFTGLVMGGCQFNEPCEDT